MKNVGHDLVVDRSKAFSRLSKAAKGALMFDCSYSYAANGVEKQIKALGCKGEGAVALIRLIDFKQWAADGLAWSWTGPEPIELVEIVNQNSSKGAISTKMALHLQTIYEHSRSAQNYVPYSERSKQ